jgi:hypothetical protein
MSGSIIHWKLLERCIWLCCYYRVCVIMGFWVPSSKAEQLRLINCNFTDNNHLYAECKFQLHLGALNLLSWSRSFSGIFKSDTSITKWHKASNKFDSIVKSVTKLPSVSCSYRTGPVANRFWPCPVSRYCGHLWLHTIQGKVTCLLCECTLNVNERSQCKSCSEL